jgi:lipopolysaccharide transport system permease protein
VKRLARALAAEARPEVPRTIIKPSRGWISLGLDEVWQYRELMYFLVWRDVKVRYKQTALGAAWAILQPLLTMLVFTLFFGGLAKVGSDGLPYPIFSYAGLLPWTLFAEGVARSSQSLVASSNLIKKVYFPRLVVPASSVLAGVLDFAIAFVVLIGLMAYYGIWPSATIVFLPVLFLLVLGIGLGVGVWLAALNVKYRDFRYVVPFIVQFGLYISPVGFSSAIVPEKWRLLYDFNPMVGVIDGFRWAISNGRSAFPQQSLLLSLITIAILLASGIWYFRKTERTFADVI